MRWLAPDASSGREAVARAVGFHLGGGNVGDADIVAMINAHWEHVAFSLPQTCAWRRVADTSLSAPLDICEEGLAQSVGASRYIVSPRSVAVLIN